MATHIFAPGGASTPAKGITNMAGFRATPTQQHFGAQDATDRKDTIGDRCNEATDAAIDALTLIHAAADLNERGPCVTDIGTITDAKSRVTALLIMARDRTAAAIEAMNQIEQEVLHG